jgi:F0F1-type ATP synthase assembly protein I
LWPFTLAKSDLLCYNRARGLEKKESVPMKKSSMIGLAMELSWTMLFALLLPLLLGIWLDHKFHTTPLFVLIGTFLGILAATVGVARMVMRMRPGSRDGNSDNQAKENREEERE